MKKLFTLAIALAAFLAVNAQAPADWKVGDDVAAELGLGDCSGAFEFSGTATANDYGASDVKDFGKYWKGDVHPNEYGGIDEVHLLGYYNADPFDIYQVVKIPAGSYTLRVQSHYREGTPANSFVSYFNGTPKKNAFVYANVLPSDDANATPVRTFEKAVVSIAASGITQQLYTNPDVSWQNDAKSPKTTDADGNDVYYYCPCCVKGVATYFAAGCYWNQFNIILTEDAFVRIGFKKIAKINDDSFPFANLQVIYNGEAGEAAKLESAKDDCREALKQLETYQNDFINAGFDGLAGSIDDYIMETNTAIEDATTTDETDKVLADINANIESFTNVYKTAKELDDLFQSARDLEASSNFPGIDDFSAALTKATADAKTDDVEKLGDDPTIYLKTIYEALSVARADYLNSQEKDEKGAIDFSGLIKHPWFVNAEYTPTKNDDGTWTLKEGGWADWGRISGDSNGGSPKNYAEMNLAALGVEDICSKVVLSGDDKVTNQWYKLLVKQSGWSAGVQLMYQGGLVGVSQGWCDGFDGYEGVAQQLVGLPNGYYSLKGLVRGNGTNAHLTWNDDNVPPYHNIFAQNSEEVCVRSVVGRTDYYYSPAYGWYEWNPNVWQEHETGTIMITDGKLLIGGQSSMISNFTGFRLMYYGLTPPFDDMISEALDKVKGQVDELLFAGDKAKVEEILASIKLPIIGADAYDKALADIASARDYITRAINKQKSFNAAQTLESLADREYIAPAYEYMVLYGDKTTDTYDKVDELNETANVYKTYCGVHDKAVALNDANVNAIIDRQVAELKTTVKDADGIGAFLDELALPYNTAVINANGGKDASADKPANITSLLRNADLKEGPKTAWDCVTADPSNNSYGRHLAECWNQDPFTISQSLASLPAGIYEFRVRALYRDGGAVDQAMIDRFNAAGGDYEAWENHNVVLFANDAESYVKSICEGKFTERSFDKWYNAGGGDAAGDFKDAGFVQQSYNSNICVLEEEWAHIADWGIDVTDTDLMGAVTEVTPETEGNPENIFDTQVGDYFFPCSTAGFMYRIQKSPEAYCNSVRVVLAENGDLKVGFRKNKKIDSDWLIYDNFELYYLGIDETAIKDINAISTNSPVYNISGQRVSDSYKGIVIKDGKKYMNK